MTRISTYSASQTALMDLMRAQRSVYDAQQQLTTGKYANDLKGIGNRAETLSAARSARDRSEGFKEAAIRTEARLETQDLALNRIAEAATEMRVGLTTIDGTYIMQAVETAFREVSNALGARHASGYVFGGTRANENPLGVNSLDDLIPLADASEAFQNSDRKAQVQLDSTIVLDVGMLADDVAGDLMASFKRIAEFNAGADGPFNGPLTANQQAFVETELGNLIAAIDRLNDKTGENGAVQSRVETMIASQNDRIDFLERMISDMEDVDMAEAATRFQQAQTAVDVSARTFSTLSQVSLLPFLR